MMIRKVGIDRVGGSPAGQTDEHEEGDEILENHVGLSSWLIAKLSIVLRFVDCRVCINRRQAAA
jgi:hypothetical protein